ncbi:archease [Halopelagius longus]|uniref:Archease n=1 Tax=Halopelagius longus TaxID=1236180 RepID=A0A1H0Z1K3_9EURY|nr:archease [Halopelagius longus]RDI72770.1 archease [Halopelagius longus]SDQ20966.1 SHS2 domain-containing protein [Halopelagius longus]
MSFELREHTADVAVEATASDLSGAFAAVADGLAAAGCDAVPPTGGERFGIEVRAEGAEALLFDYLDQLIYERDVRGVLPVDNDAEVRAPEEGDGEWVLDGSARGVPLSAVDAREIKAVTYSEMSLEETADGWRAYVVFDV